MESGIGVCHRLFPFLSLSLDAALPGTKFTSVSGAQLIYFSKDLVVRSVLQLYRFGRAGGVAQAAALADGGQHFGFEDIAP